MTFFKLPNNIFKYNLSATTFIVYSYLLFRQGKNKSIDIKADIIAKNCNISRPSVIKAVKILENENLIKKQNRYNYDSKYIANRYTIAKLPGSFTRINKDVFKTDIKPTDFLIYCFINKCMDKENNAFPSLSRISKAIHISRSRVAKAVKYLREYTFLNRIRRKKKDKSFKQNKYTFFFVKSKVNTTKKAGQYTWLAFLYIDGDICIYFYYKGVVFIFYNNLQTHSLSFTIQKE